MSDLIFFRVDLIIAQVGNQQERKVMHQRIDCEKISYTIAKILYFFNIYAIKKDM